MIIEKLLMFLERNIHQKRISKFLQNRSIKTIIDVGAHKGEFAQKALQMESVNKIIAFEPQKKIFNLLKEKFSDNDKVVLNNFALSDKVEKRIMKINKMTATSTLNHEINDNSLYFKFKSFLLYQKNSIIDEEEIDTTTFDTFFNEEIFNENTLLKIDTEGYEMHVLKGSEQKIKEVKYILIENQFSKMYKNVNFKDCHDFLRKKNFKLLKRFRFPTLHYEDRLYINEHKDI
ncbi:FkbM family methyltransferase [Candidatus Pelagibacter sp.]|jgi:FkbM family methyltransferase|nr:FkbM family methyltransferase [Candidatus Pelagibacter sp.]